MRRERIDLRVRADEKEAWAVFAKQHGLGLSELIRRAVNNLMKMAPDKKK